ncbi:MAG: tetratricopeptide repeat protein, partial [Gemmataceae bacterium]|nr:tetratricopeptide repeat protein [Gemmataceae bacterium]
MSANGARPGTWRRRHPRLTVGGLVVVAALLSWAGYRGGWYLWARAHFRAAHQAVDRHAWSEAHQHLEACLRGWPNSPAAHLLAARAARRLELFHEAEEHLEACQRLQHADTQATQVERALLRVHRGDLTGAEPFLRACVAQEDPNTVEILDILSAALILHYRVTDAQRCLDELLRRQPDHFHALVRRGWTARSTSEYAAAVEFFQKALALQPDADAVRLALAELLLAIGRLADAQEHFEHLRQQQPENPSVLFGLARCRAGTGQPEKARQLLDRLLADHPSDWKALGERGRLSLQLGRTAEAEGDLRRAIALAPPDLPLLTHFADCLRLLGR